MKVEKINPVRLSVHFKMVPVAADVRGRANIIGLWAGPEEGACH